MYSKLLHLLYSYVLFNSLYINIYYLKKEFVISCSRNVPEVVKDLKEYYRKNNYYF
jgi:hypothetical protein